MSLDSAAALKINRDYCDARGARELFLSNLKNPRPLALSLVVSKTITNETDDW